MAELSLGRCAERQQPEKAVLPAPREEDDNEQSHQQALKTVKTLAFKISARVRLVRWSVAFVRPAGRAQQPAPCSDLS